MKPKHRKNLLSKMDDRVLTAAFVFAGIALFSSLLKADIRSVEKLEFSRVELIGSNDLEFTQADKTELKIRGDQSKLTPEPFALRGNTLLLGVTADGKEVRGVKYRLSGPMLESLLVQGSGNAYVRPLEAEFLSIAVEGSGDIRMFDVNAKDLDMSVSGSGTVQAVKVSAKEAKLSLSGSGDILLGSLQAGSLRTWVKGSGDVRVEEDGRADDVKISLMGSGDASLGKLRATVANVSIMGSGDVKLTVDEELVAEIIGSGDIKYWGSPRTDKSVLGSGDIEQQD
jgi:hypothetical protein